MHTAEHIDLDNTEIPRMWAIYESDETSPPDQSFNWQPRVLKYEGIQSTDGGDTWDWSGNIRSDYPNFESVSFDDLVDDYYDGAIEQFNDGIELEVYFKLSFYEIKALDLRKPIYFESDHPNFSVFTGTWIVNQIKTDILKSQTVKVSLVSVKGFSAHKEYEDGYLIDIDSDDIENNNEKIKVK